MEDFEKLGVFYLGREKGDDGNLLLYPSKHLTTHGMIVGMTGSGKTGLAIDLIEEAAIDGIPALLIDPKGDLANILLQFPSLAPADFQPWIDREEARRAGLTVEQSAEKTAATWRDGLAKWGEDGDRIARLKASADYAVYTPGDTTGRPIQLLSSFAAPKGADEATLRDTVVNSVSGLLGLVGIAADPVQSREHILLSAILYSEWKAGRELDLARLINFVTAPPFAKIGVFDVESFYPSKDRMKLAMLLNNLLASPSFAAWRDGEPLDIQSLLWTPEGRPRVSVLSIAHLSDAERMFFVTTVLNATIAWMRRQSGTGSLRALLYMDEIFGYFPPNANPPSKPPMLTLLKQARAFGLGIVLSTQNPVDLDYKGLSNCGTWFIGRLQTDRDKQRVLDGLESAAADSGSGFDRAAIDRLLSGLGKRVFLMRDAADDRPVLFETRWSMSYLCGPLSMAQIRSLIPAPTAPAFGVDAAATPSGLPSPFAVGGEEDASAPAVPSPFAVGGAAPSAGAVAPENVAASVRLHFVDAKSATDKWTSVFFQAEIADGTSPDWSGAVRLAAQPERNAALGAIPPKTSALWAKMLTSYVFQEISETLYRDPDTKLLSKFGEAQGDFRLRAAQRRRERRDAAVEKVEAAYAKKLQTLDDKIRAADNRVTREKAMGAQKKQNALIWAGTAALGAILGKSIFGRAGSVLRSGTQISKKQQDLAIAQENYETLKARREDLEREFRAALEEVQVEIDPSQIELEELTIRPRKSDMVVENLWYV